VAFHSDEKMRRLLRDCAETSSILGYCRDHTIVPSTPVGEPIEMTEWNNKHRSIPNPNNNLLHFFSTVGKEAFEKTLIIIDDAF